MKIAAWQLGLEVGVFLLIIMVDVGMGSLGHNWSSYNDEPSSNFPICVIICGFGFFAVGIARFILWIMGIVNACNINTITNNSSILIIFSIFTLFIAHIIVAVRQRKQFASGSFTGNNQNINSSNFGNNNQNNYNYNSENNFEAKLKKQFIDDAISSEEYEKILKQFKKQIGVMMKLKKYIKNQILYAGWQIASLLGVIIFFVIILATLVGRYDSGYAGAGPIIGTIGMVIFGSTWLVLWIIGIINAYKINSITKKSGVLVAFAIIPIPLIHIIIAIKEQKNILKNE